MCNFHQGKGLSFWYRILSKPSQTFYMFEVVKMYSRICAIQSLVSFIASSVHYLPTFHHSSSMTYFSQIGTNYVVDATLEEELCMTVRLTVAVNKKGNICGIQKGGHGGLEPSSMYEMLSVSFYKLSFINT